MLIREIAIRKALRNRQIAIVMTGIVLGIVALSSIYSNFDILEAYAGVTLSNDNVAKTIQVRITPSGTINEVTYDSFSRVGFVDGETNFLLESVPSKDKRPFYELVKKSLEDKRPESSDNRMHVAIDLFSGDGEVIQSLEYRDCSVTEYFVHGVDSKGKIFFLEEDGTVEIREVSKFACVGFTLNFDPQIKKLAVDDVLSELDELDEETRKFEYHGNDPFASFAPKDSGEGELFFNSMTNTLQKLVNGTWVDISGKGGPPSPRR